MIGDPKDFDLRVGSNFSEAGNVLAWPIDNSTQVVSNQFYTQEPIKWDTYYDYWHQWIPTYCPIYVQTWNEKSKIETAFKILHTLMNLKLVKLEKVSDFVEVVNKIAEVL